jgi:hypothetical protein
MKRVALMLPLACCNGTPASVPCSAYLECASRCAGAVSCIQACAVPTACTQCINAQVFPCGVQNGCSSNQTGCMCMRCGPAIAQCLSGTFCSTGGAGGIPGASGSRAVGQTCDMGTLLCAPGLRCDTTFTGGYCTKDCLGDHLCPSGAICVTTDTTGDGTPDIGNCYASCMGMGSCPRPADECHALPAGFGSVCLPH